MGEASGGDVGEASGGGIGISRRGDVGITNCKTSRGRRDRCAGKACSNCRDPDSVEIPTVVPEGAFTRPPAGVLVRRPAGAFDGAPKMGGFPSGAFHEYPVGWRSDIMTK